jgi:hypothetical protein
MTINVVIQSVDFLNGKGEKKSLWEVKVPVADNDGVVFDKDHHEAFRRILRSISGGLTCNPALEGEWEHGNKLYTEPMIALQFRAVRADAERIAIHARKYYRQIEIMAHKIADESDIIFVDANGVRR